MVLTLIRFLLFSVLFAYVELIEMPLSERRAVVVI